ncbi:MAG TPA: 2-C-methyl-D-erythritol 4-phosphate cytidylyltransferase [Candidatus Kapabacteria bacterium]|nr:2-C-methyl-D-erythritol 4-phosphate cytidylyltransferase [Candidatus Kapabacteria bacterium]
MQNIHAIIVAAGSGTRFGAPKQLVMLGKPLYRHSLDRFAEHPAISRIVLVVSDDIRTAIERDLSNPKIEIVTGGATRQRSVSNGLAKLSDVPPDDIILVHDAARPGVSAEIITSLIEAIKRSDAALAAIPVVDTLKRDEGGNSVETISRDHLWRAQTPQGATHEILSQAFAAAEREAYEATDEAELLERIGIRATLVLGSEKNMKVTYPEDLDRVARLMQ